MVVTPTGLGPPFDSSGSHHHLAVSDAPQSHCPHAFWAAAQTPQAVPRPFFTLGRRWRGMEDGSMPDATPPVDLAGLAAGGNHPGARWRLDGEDLQANLVRLDQGDRIQPHPNDEVDVLVVVVLGRAS